MRCPVCEGRKAGEAILCGHGHCQIKTVVCEFCRGTGEVEEQRVMAYQEGRRRRNDRVARGVSLRQEAARLGISAMELGRIERGVA